MKIAGKFLFAIIIAAILLCGGFIFSTHKSQEPIYLGRPLNKWLQNISLAGSSNLTLMQMLTLKQIKTGEEPEIATFEVPISYDSLTNIGDLLLLVDARDGSTQSGVGEFQECDRATNGNCLLEWNTTLDSPGKHLLQAQLIVTGQLRKPDTFKINGPTLIYYSSNVVQFDSSYDSYDSNGAILHAKVFETNAAYSIELRTPSGQHIKTITGSTSNGTIEEFWDLTDDKGNKYTNVNEVRVIFNVTNLPSGTFSTQKLR